MKPVKGGAEEAGDLPEDGFKYRLTAITNNLRKFWVLKDPSFDNVSIVSTVSISRGLISLALGIICGIVPITGFAGFALFGLLSIALIEVWIRKQLDIDPLDYGDDEFYFVKIGFVPAFSLFLLVWISTYSNFSIGLL